MKHPVPKKKTSKSRTRSRHSSFKRDALNRLEGMAAAAGHRFAKAEKLLKEEKQKKAVEKITKVKA